MIPYCVSCKTYTANKIEMLEKNKQNRLMLLSNWAACGKKNDFYKK